MRVAKIISTWAHIFYMAFALFSLTILSVYLFFLRDFSSYERVDANSFLFAHALYDVRGVEDNK